MSFRFINIDKLTMAFARKLKNLQISAQSAFIEEVVNDVIRQFETACNQEAGKGLEHVSCTTKSREHDELSLYDGKAILLRATEQVRSRVASLGVSSIRVQLLTLCCSQCAKMASQEIYCCPRSYFKQNVQYAWNIQASWHDVEAQAESQGGEAAGGPSLQCPICFETSAAVALVPCGHTMCRNCATRVLNAPCPSCRRHVTRMTMGLYIDMD
mmetsp:Transcript_104529/g.181517  ORF Transcript_104529/g.181517 Transcript_104529/m.181517 type:complete len:213 (-) Transcript_104529:73-711(-)